MISIKSPKEMQAMQRANAVAAKALLAARDAVKAGNTTQDVDAAVQAVILAEGAKPNFKGYGGFPASACVSMNDEVIHGIPSKATVLKEGDIVSVDTGALVDGYNGDNAFTFTVGEVSETAKALLQVTRAALYKAIEAAVPGNRIGDIGHVVQELVEANGFSVVRDYVGHGIGREMHEAPEVPNFGRPGHGPRLVPGMTIAIEPMVNEKGDGVQLLDDGWTVKTRDGGLSAHFEHTVAITKDGPVLLTESALWTG